MDIGEARHGELVGNTRMINGGSSDYSKKIGQNIMINRLDSVGSRAKYCKRRKKCYSRY